MAYDTPPKAPVGRQPRSTFLHWRLASPHPELGGDPGFGPGRGLTAFAWTVEELLTFQGLLASWEQADNRSHARRQS